MLKKLISHTAIYGFASQIPKVASIFSLPIITKYLTETDFGVYGLITSIVAGISILANLGLNITLTNSYYKSRNHYKIAWRQVYGALILWSIPYAVFLAAIIYLFIPLEAKENATAIILLNVLPVILFGPVMLLGSLYYQLQQKPNQIAMRVASIGILTVLLNLLLIAHYKLGYMGWFISGAISQVLLQASYWIPMNLNLKITPIFNFKKRYIFNQLKITLPTVPHFYGAYLLNSSDRIVMDVTNVSIANIGMYNAAGSVSGIFNQISGAVAQAISPMLYSSYKEGNEKTVKRLIFSVEILFLIGTAVSSIWMKEIFQILIKNKTLQTVYPTAIILSMAFNYRPMYFGANNRLFYYEKTKVLLKITFIAGLSNVILNFIFIPVFGWQVAAYTTFVCLMYMGYIGYFLKEFKETNETQFYPLFWLTLTILLTAFVYFAVDWSLLIKVILSLVFVFGGLISLRLINK